MRYTQRFRFVSYTHKRSITPEKVFEQDAYTRGPHNTAGLVLLGLFVVHVWHLISDAGKADAHFRVCFRVPAQKLGAPIMKRTMFPMAVIYSTRRPKHWTGSSVLSAARITPTKPPKLMVIKRVWREAGKASRALRRAMINGTKIWRNKLGAQIISLIMVLAYTQTQLCARQSI